MLHVMGTCPPALPGGGFRPFWHLHHPALHAAQLVRHLLQVAWGCGVPCACGAGCAPQSLPLVFAPSRMIQNSFVDMENMFELFHEEQEVGGPLLSPLPGMTPRPCPGAEAASPSIR